MFEFLKRRKKFAIQISLNKNRSPADISPELVSAKNNKSR
jgi:3'-phosphoadenosine 5'-phosphosulfate (PAPS) 3'-phosphatase